jgi:GT2 family glycosyltransferase
MSGLSIGITTRHRPEALARLLRSLPVLRELDPQVLIFDDGSEPPAAETLATIEPSGLNVSIIRDDSAPGYIVGRNRLVREATAPLVLLLDDDTVIFGAEPVRRAMGVLQRDPAVAAVGFAQAEADGSPWPEGMQAGRGEAPALVPSFIGFAHLVRRDAFLAHGGYREMLVFYGEEKELCVRWLDAGLHTVYLPDALVGHVTAAGNRSASRYVRYAMRNDCLVSLLSHPLPLALASIPLRLWRYTRMASRIPDGDPGGLRWMISELVRLWPDAWRERRPVSWRTIRRWRHLARHSVPYVAP